MQYFNLVYAKHHETDSRAYLYELPLGMDVKPFDKLYVADKHGEHVVSVFADNFICTKGTTRTLCEANGGYFPPAKVIGTVDIVTVRQEKITRFKEEFPF